MSFRRLIRVVFFSLSIVLIAFIIHRADATEIASALRSIGAMTILALVFLQALTVLLVALQWQMLFRAADCDVRFNTVVAMNMIGVFFESVTPAMKTGGEGAKLLYLKSINIPLASATPVLLAQKVYSFSTFAFFALCAFVVAYPQLSVSLRTVLTCTGITVLSVAVVGFFVWRWLRKNRFHSQWWQRFSDTLRVIRHKGIHKPAYTASLVLMSLSIWALLAFKLHIVLAALSIDIAWLDTAVTTFISYAVGLLPLSPGGLGPFEAVMGSLLYPAFTTATLAVTATFVFRFFSHWAVFLVSVCFVGITYFTSRIVAHA